MPIVRQTVEFFGYILFSEGLYLTPSGWQLCRIFLHSYPQNIAEVCQFLGLALYYHCFIAQFTKVASPIHWLTGKDVRWERSHDCQIVFGELKQYLLNSSILIYPDFDLNFVLETDATIDGLNAILSQKKIDNKLHPVAYASWSTSSAEQCYNVTELEALAVVWAVQHFRAYLYWHVHTVTVITDHSAVKSIIDKPVLMVSMHVGGWKLESRVGQLTIIHRPGCESDRADAFSYNPVLDDPNGTSIDEMVLEISTEEKITDLLAALMPENNLHQEQRKDPKPAVFIEYLEVGVPQRWEGSQKNCCTSYKVCHSGQHVAFADHKKTGRRRAAVSSHL